MPVYRDGHRERKKNLKRRYKATIAEENTILSTKKKPEFRLKPEVAHPCSLSILKRSTKQDITENAGYQEQFSISNVSRFFVSIFCYSQMRLMSGNLENGPGKNGNPFFLTKISHLCCNNFMFI